MGKLFRIRMLRLEKTKAREQGVSESELAILAGTLEEPATRPAGEKTSLCNDGSSQLKSKK